MKKIICLIITILSFNLHAWTLNPSTARAFDDNKIDIFIANDDCSSGGFSTSKYQSMIKSAVKDYWNAVPTSSLHLKVKGIRSDISINGDDHDAAMLKVPDNTILAGCNDDADDFGNPAILGSAQMECSGSVCKAVLILNITSGSNLGTKSDSDLEAIIAHEIGHAFGLGHSEYKHNLMYFSISGKFQKWLGMDDINGVTYLYPNDSSLDILGLSALGNCGAVANTGDANHHPSLFNFISSLFFGIILIFFIRFLMRRFKN